MTTPPLVEIIWQDTTHSEGWYTFEQLNTMIEADPEDFMIRSIGYLISKDEDRLILVSSILDRQFELEESHVVSDIFRIPINTVKELVVLERPNG